MTVVQEVVFEQNEECHAGEREMQEGGRKRAGYLSKSLQVIV